MWLATLCLLAPVADDFTPKAMDFVIRNVTIHDGGGKAGVQGDIAFAGPRIFKVGKFEIISEPRIINGAD